MLPIIEKHEPVPSDDGTMLVTLSDGRREWSVPVTVVRHRGRLASHVYRPARARGVDARRRAAQFRAPPAVATTTARKLDARAKAPKKRAPKGTPAPGTPSSKKEKLGTKSPRARSTSVRVWCGSLLGGGVALLLLAILLELIGLVGPTAAERAGGRGVAAVGGGGGDFDLGVCVATTAAPIGPPRFLVGPLVDDVCELPGAAGPIGGFGGVAPYAVGKRGLGGVRRRPRPPSSFEDLVGLDLCIGGAAAARGVEPAAVIEPPPLSSVPDEISPPVAWPPAGAAAAHGSGGGAWRVVRRRRGLEPRLALAVLVVAWRRRRRAASLRQGGAEGGGRRPSDGGGDARADRGWDVARRRHRGSSGSNSFDDESGVGTAPSRLKHVRLLRFNRAIAGGMSRVTHETFRRPAFNAARWDTSLTA